MRNECGDTYRFLRPRGIGHDRPAACTGIESYTVPLCSMLIDLNKRALVRIEDTLSNAAAERNWQSIR